MNNSKYGKFNEILDKEEFNTEIEKLGHQLKSKFIKMYMKMANEAISEVSYCNRLKVGALLVTVNNEMLMGYNGKPSGFDNCCELPGQDVTDPRTLHGEANAMSKAERSTLSIQNGSLFVTHIPCIECAKRIIQSGIKRVFYMHDYRLTDGIELLTDPRTNIQVIRLNSEYEIDKIFGHYKPILSNETQFIYDALMKEIGSLKNKIDYLTKNCQCCQDKDRAIKIWRDEEQE